MEKEEEDIFPDPTSAPTLAYDSEVMGDVGRDGTVPVDQAGRVTVPALVLTGGADYPWMIDVGRRLADAMPNGRHRVLKDARINSTVEQPRVDCRFVQHGLLWPGYRTSVVTTIR